jgi:hypothetical protein
MDTRGPASMTVAASFSHNIPSTLLQDHQLRLEYLQPKEHLYGCGGIHIRIGKRISSPSQYIIPRPQ